jgi:formylglycine-generating enzyme required for sulfatase activity
MRYSFFTAAFLLLCCSLTANNVQLTNINVINNAGNTGKVVQFDISWENSWRTTSTSNYDGVWVFFKFKDNNGRWYPLRFTNTDNSVPAGFTQQIDNNNSITGVGMFLYRSTLGFGTSTLTGVQAGIQSMPGTFDIRGFALEMVYVPQGNFYLGDSALSIVTNFRYRRGTTEAPYLVTGNGSSITYGTGAAQLFDPLASNISNGDNYAGFPSGFAPFWMMKYELSQGAYRDFLNTLTYAQQDTRNGNPPNSPVGTRLESLDVACRQFIEIAVSGTAPNTPAVYGCDGDNDNIFNEATDGEWLGVSGVTYTDCAAYLDWAGLRPMTEFEFEKACRGPLYPVPQEYAWGTAEMADFSYTLVNALTENENVVNPSSFYGNAINDSSGIRVSRGGVFATAISTRISSGASYYGIMDLSGSMNEFTVATQNTAGRVYTGKQGDGLLTAAGNANENYWPGVNGFSTGEYNGGDGVSFDDGTKTRGGSWQDSFVRLNISNRASFPGGLGTTLDTGSIISTCIGGIRGVRNAN